MSRDIDNAFKAIISAGWANQSDGNVEAPTGFFSIIDMSTERDMLREVLAESALDDALGQIEPSWYLTMENNQGILYYAQAKDEAAAQEWFKSLCEKFYEWDED